MNDGTAGRLAEVPGQLRLANFGDPKRSDMPADPREPAILLATKLSAPAIRSKVIDRAVLVSRLSSSTDRKLTLLSAPAGWGKTTLLTQWFRGEEHRARLGWLTLDSTDNDPTRFWTCALASLDKASPGLADGAVAMLTRGADIVRTVLPILVNDLDALCHHVVLVLDDYHVVANPVVHEQLTYLLERMPSTLRLVIASRSDPMLPLARLRARGELLEIRLRFRRIEVGQLLNEVLGLSLTEAQVAVLAARTEGWAAGLHLAALSLAGRNDNATSIQDFDGDNRHIVDYLIAEVLDGQTPETRAFLLQTSLLRKLSGQLCDEALQTTKSAALLEQIERENLFLLPLDNSRRWYRYHHLFAEVLRTQLRDQTHPDLIAEIHRRAAAWLVREGLIDEALHHLLSAGDVAASADLVAANWVGEMNRGHLSTVSAWIDQLPQATVQSDPRLSIARAFVALNFNQPAVVKSSLDDAEVALADAPGERSRFRTELDILHAFRELRVGNLVAALESAYRATVEGGGDPPASMSDAYGLYAAAHYYLGQVGDAEKAWTKAVAHASPTNDQRAQHYALAYLALVAAERGELGVAQGFLTRVNEIAVGWPLVEHSAGMSIAMIATAVIAELQGDPTVAMKTADMAVASARSTAGILELAKVLSINARIAECRGTRQSAVTARQEVNALLNGVVHADVIARLHTPRERGRPVRHRTRVNYDKLTDKEREILQLLATNLSRREIGERLFVSLNTVKSHQRALYRKLGAESRAAAVDRARQLGLMHSSNHLSR